MKKESFDSLPLAHDFDRGWSLKSDEEEKAEIGARIRSFRQSRTKLTHEQLSKLTETLDPQGKGISRVALSRYETGAAFPGVREIKLLARSLRLTVSALLYGDPDDPMDYRSPSIQDAIEELVSELMTKRDGGQSLNQNSGGYEELIAAAKRGSSD